MLSGRFSSGLFLPCGAVPDPKSFGVISPDVIFIAFSSFSIYLVLLAALLGVLAFAELAGLFLAAGLAFALTAGFFLVAVDFLAAGFEPAGL
jgi:hypothetical protein